MVWYAHHFKNFPQSVVIHTDNGFDVVNKAEVDVFLELSCFFYNPVDENSLGLQFITVYNNIFIKYIIHVLNKKDKCASDSSFLKQENAICFIVLWKLNKIIYLKC